MSAFNPGLGPYNYPQVTISNPLVPPPEVFTNVNTLLQANIAGVMIFYNGVLLTQGLDYTINGSQVTFTVPPSSGDVMTAAVFQLGLQLGGPNPQRYVTPVTFPILGAFDGTATYYQISTGPTIFGATDGVNAIFTVGVALRRMQVFRNGILQTGLQDVSTGPTVVVFMPGNIPQPGDILMILGWV